MSEELRPDPIDRLSRRGGAGQHAAAAVMQGSSITPGEFDMERDIESDADAESLNADFKQWLKEKQAGLR